ncbi:MAG: chorismate synthase [Candidatus Zixiibacteriota bacterium]
MLTYLTAGESHGPQVTAILDGLPAGMSVSIEQINHHLARRQKGYGRGGRMKIEQDRAEILSGVRHSMTMGGPVTLAVRNKDWPNWSAIMDPISPLPVELNLRQKHLALDTTTPRPGHADLAGGIKWHHYDLRNVLERASARETAARTAIGSLACQLLQHFDIRIASHVVAIGKVSLPRRLSRADLDSLVAVAEQSDVRCIDDQTSRKMMQAIRDARKRRDSLGGVVELIVRGLPVGLGGFSQWHHRLDGRLAGALMAVHSVKGVEIGLGFESARRYGSQVHDQIYYSIKQHAPKKGFYRRTNNAGGLEAGVTNGEDIVVRVASKPLSTLNRPLDSVDVKTKRPSKAMVERTDHCVVPALGVVCEAVAALVLADAFLEKFGADNLSETERNYRAFLDTPY